MKLFWKFENVNATVEEFPYVQRSSRMRKCTPVSLKKFTQQPQWFKTGLTNYIKGFIPHFEFTEKFCNY